MKILEDYSRRVARGRPFLLLTTIAIGYESANGWGKLIVVLKIFRRIILNPMY